MSSMVPRTLRSLALFLALAAVSAQAQIIDLDSGSGFTAAGAWVGLWAFKPPLLLQ